MVAMTHRSTATREWSASLRFDSATASCLVEGLGCCVLIEDPQVKRSFGPQPNEVLRSMRQQECAYSGSLQVARDVKILEERPPLRVFVHDGVGEPEDFISATGDHGEVARCGLGQSTSPHHLAIGEDIPVEVGVRVGAPIVTAPALGVEGGNGFAIALGRTEILDSKGSFPHAGLHIDPGMHRATAGRPTFKGQVPQVSLDEQGNAIRDSSGCPRNVTISHAVPWRTATHQISTDTPPADEGVQWSYPWLSNRKSFREETGESVVASSGFWSNLHRRG